MKTIQPQDFYDTIIVRTTKDAIQLIHQDKHLQAIIDDDDFVKAISVANLFVYGLIVDYKRGALVDKGKIKRLLETLINYKNRMSINPTPFGLFSSVSTLTWSDTMKKPIINNHQPSVRLDNRGLNTFINLLNTRADIKNKVTYVPNNTIYTVEDDLRYFEQYYESDTLKLRLASVENSDLIKSILEFTNLGRKRDEISSYLKQGELGDYDLNEIELFLTELVDSQLLVSTLQLNITAQDPLEHLSSYLVSLRLSETENQFLFSVIDSLSAELEKMASGEADFSDGTSNIKAIFEGIGLKVDDKCLIQVDLFNTFESPYLSESIRNDLISTGNILSYFKHEPVKPRLVEFKKKFTEKYEDAWMPLLNVLDSDIGIGFGNFFYQSDNILFQEGLILTKENVKISHPDESSEMAKAILFRKLLQAIKDDQYTLYLEHSDFPGLENRVHTLAPTFQVLFSVLNLDNQLIHLNNIGNASAGNLVSRFANHDSKINDVLTDIGKFEDEYFDDMILAEIVHTPEARVGNITSKPAFRHYEIPIINQSSKPADAQVLLKDIWVTVRHNKIILVSEKLKKRIIPILTTAHNYNKKTNPVYQFLSESYYQDTTPSLTFDISDHFANLTFIPRIQHKSVILQFARWTFTKEDLGLLFENSGQLNNNLIESFTARRKIPSICQYSIDRNITLLNWRDIESVELFIANARTIPMIIVSEFPIDLKDGFIKDCNGKIHHSECVAFVKNKLRIKQLKINYPEQLAGYLKDRIQQKYFPGDDWVYLKVYSSRTMGDKLLREYLAAVLPELYKGNHIDKFFFIRYNDPEYHLRLRFHSTIENKADLIRRLTGDLRGYAQDNLIWKIEIDTYNREVGRYGYRNIEIAEDIFEADSLFWVRFNSISDKKVDFYLPIFFIKSVYELLNVFQVEIKDCYELINRMSRAYENEFSVNSNKIFQKYLNNKEQTTRQIVEHVLKDNFADLQKVINTEKYKAALDEFKERLSTVSLKHDLCREKKEYLTEKLNSLIHMQATRCFKSKVRENELFAYSVLNGYYKKLFYKSTATIHERNTA